MTDGSFMFLPTRGQQKPEINSSTSNADLQKMLVSSTQAYEDSKRSFQRSIQPIPNAHALSLTTSSTSNVSSNASDKPIARFMNSLLVDEQLNDIVLKNGVVFTTPLKSIMRTSFMMPPGNVYQVFTEDSNKLIQPTKIISSQLTLMVNL